MSISILGVIRKYSVVVTIPIVTASLIWADYSYTAEWKRKCAEDRQKIVAPF